MDATGAFCILSAKAPEKKSQNEGRKAMNYDVFGPFELPQTKKRNRIDDTRIKHEFLKHRILVLNLIERKNSRPTAALLQAA